MPAHFTNQFFARLQAARSQLLQLDWWSEKLPPEQVIDLHDVVRINDVLLLAKRLVSREKTAAFVQLLSPDRPVTAGGVRLAVKLAHGTIKAFVQRYGHFDRDVQEWVLPGERVYVENRAARVLTTISTGTEPHLSPRLPPALTLSHPSARRGTDEVSAAGGRIGRVTSVRCVRRVLGDRWSGGRPVPGLSVT